MSPNTHKGPDFSAQKRHVLAQEVDSLIHFMGIICYFSTTQFVNLSKGFHHIRVHAPGATESATVRSDFTCFLCSSPLKEDVKSRVLGGETTSIKKTLLKNYIKYKFDTWGKKISELYSCKHYHSGL